MQIKNMNTMVLFDIPQKEIASLITTQLSTCQNASIVTGFLTPSGVRTLATPIRARPQILKNFVVGSATYPGFEALDQLVTWGVPIDRLRVHLTVGWTQPCQQGESPNNASHDMLGRDEDS